MEGLSASDFVREYVSQSAPVVLRQAVSRMWADMETPVNINELVRNFPSGNVSVDVSADKYVVYRVKALCEPACDVAHVPSLFHGTFGSMRVVRPAVEQMELAHLVALLRDQGNSRCVWPCGRVAVWPDGRVRVRGVTRRRRCRLNYAIQQRDVGDIWPGTVCKQHSAAAARELV